MKITELNLSKFVFIIYAHVICHAFCTHNTPQKNCNFLADLLAHKVMWLHNGMSNFRKLGVKNIPEATQQDICASQSEHKFPGVI